MSFWSWLAGFYEGEGYPGWVYSNGPNKRYPHADWGRRRISIMISQKDRRVLQYIKRELARRGFKSSLAPVKWTGGNRTSKVIVSLSLCPAFAKRILPHMRAPHKIKQLKDALRGRFHKA